MSQNEASARLKINSLLQESAWRLTDTDLGRANVAVETYVSISERLGETFARLKGGFADYILHDDQQFPLCVIEAKAENINPLVGKEQARSYATSQHCRFVILSNGNQHFLWDLDLGNPRIIQTFPTLAELKAFDEFKPTSSNLVNELIGDDYIVRTQMPNYASDPRWQDESQRPGFIEENKLRFLRKYQIRALERIQEEIKKHGSDRFLFEMATGTGKTLTAAAVIKMFLRCGNARRVLFLVDRIELEEQADKAFREYLKNDYQCVVYKKTRGDWNKAEIVVSTIQTFLANNRYKRSFRPNDFQLVISDEAHRWSRLGRSCSESGCRR
ncbi:DEAD/DEAH box helicase family protein [Leptolyngbya sp. 7M]|uniref:DEAD/DEAH box helicase family protein n=1 Tax=Leptolyngbya sp. 7M TaxID=2812896 RepID=UPI001B8AC0A1|nr:DEAD/DEAH box helicase family protein [Leptolyngbya sp. 7M]QYO63477.1 DEAD/DEAH box helicase family protein [Leptolyngbya sp. 7M]